MLVFIYILSILVFTRISYCANILVVNPSASYSHQAAFNDLWRELSLRGHQVKLVTMFPMNNPKLTNITEISLHDIRGELLQMGNFPLMVHNADMWSSYRMIWDIAYQTSEKVLLRPAIQQLIEQKFDVVLVKFFFPEYLILGKIYNCPTILLSSYYLNDYVHYGLGNPLNPVSHPHMTLPFVECVSFMERFISVVHSIYRSYITLYKTIPGEQYLLDKYFNVSVSVQELINDVDMVLVSTHPTLQDVRALGPSTITIGHQRKPATSIPLQEDLKNFMDNAKNGFIYFSLGSNVLSKGLNKDLLRTIMQAIKEIPWKFLYKYEDDDLEGKPDNVYLIKWAPQYDILRHPNIKLFVTQGGFQSMEEAIYSAVPMVVMPFFVDQYHNAALMKKKGIAEVVDRKSLTKEDFVRAVTKIMNIASYKERITHLRQLALDVPMTGLEKAIWWIEYVIRNKGAKHLKNPAANVPLYQYFLLDVIGVLVILILLCFVTLYLLTKKLITRCMKPIKMKHKKN